MKYVSVRFWVFMKEQCFDVNLTMDVMPKKIEAVKRLQQRHLDNNAILLRSFGACCPPFRIKVRGLPCHTLIFPKKQQSFPSPAWSLPIADSCKVKGKLISTPLRNFPRHPWQRIYHFECISKSFGKLLITFKDLL